MDEDSAKKRKILSNIPTVSGTRASRAQEAAERAVDDAVNVVDDNVFDDDVSLCVKSFERSF